MEENFDHLGLTEWANTKLSDEQRNHLAQLLDGSGGVTNISQPRFLFELTRLAQRTDRDLAQLISEKALESGEDTSNWDGSDSDGFISRYWGYEAFLEGNTHLLTGSAEDRERFYRVAEKQVELAADTSERIERLVGGPTPYHEHAGYYYLAEHAADVGEFEQVTDLGSLPVVC